MSTCHSCGCNAPAHQTRVVDGKSVPLCPFCIHRREDERRRALLRTPPTSNRISETVNAEQFQAVLEEAVRSKDPVRKRLARVFRACADVLDSDAPLTDVLEVIQRSSQAYAAMAKQLLTGRP